MFQATWSLPVLLLSWVYDARQFVRVYALAAFGNGSPPLDGRLSVSSGATPTSLWACRRCMTTPTGRPPRR